MLVNGHDVDGLKVKKNLFGVVGNVLRERRRRMFRCSGKWPNTSLSCFTYQVVRSNHLFCGCVVEKVPLMKNHPSSVEIWSRESQRSDGFHIASMKTKVFCQLEVSWKVQICGRGVINFVTFQTPIHFATIATAHLRQFFYYKPSLILRTPPPQTFQSSDITPEYHPLRSRSAPAKILSLLGAGKCHSR